MSKSIGTTQSIITDDKMVIISKGRGPKYEQEFFYAIQDAVLEGYRFPEDIKNLKIRSLRNWGSKGRAVLFKMEPASEGTEPTNQLKEAKAEAEGIVNVANDSASQIIEEAKDEAARIIIEAEEQVEADVVATAENEEQSEEDVVAEEDASESEDNAEVESSESEQEEVDTEEQSSQED